MTQEEKKRIHRELQQEGYKELEITKIIRGLEESEQGLGEDIEQTYKSLLLEKREYA